MKKDKTNKTLEHLYRQMYMMNYYDSFGSIVLKNGIVLNVRSLFEYFNEYWHDYKLALMKDDKKTIEKIMRETGGVLSNDEVSINIDDIMATVSVYKMEDGFGHDLRKMIDRFKNQGDST